MSLTTIHVVRGSRGEYPDRTEWNVKAFFNEAKAKKFVEQATKKANELRAQCKADEEQDIYGKKYSNPLDPEFNADDWDETRYWVELCPLDIAIIMTSQEVAS